MKKFVIGTLTIGFLFACNGKNEEKQGEIIKLETQKDRLSFALGADQGHAIAKSGDPHYSKYNLDKIAEGFAIGMKDEDAFDESCQGTLRSLFGESGRELNEKYLDEGCQCLGKLSGVIFSKGWKKKGGFEFFDNAMVVKGFRASLYGGDTLVSRQDQMELIRNLIEELNKSNGVKLISEASKRPNTINIDGLILETIQEGKGISPNATDKVQANYILMNAVGDTLENSFPYVLETGKEIDPFQLDQVIQGWKIGMQKMKEGGKYKIYIPYELAYGERGIFNPQRNAYDIQPYENLQFYIELNKVIK